MYWLISGDEDKQTAFLPAISYETDWRPGVRYPGPRPPTFGASAGIGEAIMQNPIVQESALRATHQQISNFATGYRQSYSVDFDDADYGSAFVYYLFFSHHTSVSSVLGIHLDDEGKFYNAYYWFQRFVRLHMDKHGYDAGLEQQTFKMLEEANFDLDLEVIDTYIPL
jgi:hypothetical protein